MSQSLTLAECLCARVCHDISNPLSALSGVLDLLRRQPANEEAASIAHQAVRAAQDRLRLFRAAWCDTDESLTGDDIRALAEGLQTGSRVSLELTALTGAFPPGLGRLVLNLLLIAVESLNGNGSVAAAGSAHAGVTIAIAGPHAGWPQALAGYLTDPVQAWAALEPHGALTPLAAIIAGHADLALRMESQPGKPPLIVIDGIGG